MDLKALDLKLLIQKLIAAGFLFLVGLVLGSIGGLLFAATGVASSIAWEPILTWFGGILGFLVGFMLDFE